MLVFMEAFMHNLYSDKLKLHKRVDMATTKKTPAKKTTTRKKTTPAKRTSVKRTSSPKAPQGYRSFQLARNDSAFNTFSVTKQTVYWVVLVAFIVLAQLWILKLQIEVATLLDSQQIELVSE